MINFEIYDYIEMGFMTIVILSLPIYIFISYALLTERKKVFCSSFYKILSLLTCLDIIACMVNIFSMLEFRIPFLTPVNNIFIALTIPDTFFPTLTKETICGKLYLGFSWFLRLGQGTTGSFLAMNRASAILFPLKYKQFWSDRFGFYAKTFTILGYPFLILIFLADVEYVTDPVSMKIFPNIAHDKVRYWIFLFGAFFDALSISLIILAYIKTVLKLKKLKDNKMISSSSSNSKLKTKSKIEENMASRIAMIVCCGEILYFLFLGVSSMFEMTTKIFYLIFSPLSYTYSILNCYILFFFCSPIRNSILRKPEEVHKRSTVLAI
ncbi:unnamed protein product [Caenorhabditis angaria]|uniref:Serpentine receptor class gamma n=1 Tax=Caenorhabditis angaria TaxID=860376 RepID=A0A9P1IGL8_9PELO|nr:unnamed protein product [Caenorhabditis angaria]